MNDVASRCEKSGKPPHPESAVRFVTAFDRHLKLVFSLDSEADGDLAVNTFLIHVSWRWLSYASKRGLQNGITTLKCQKHVLHIKLAETQNNRVKTIRSAGKLRFSKWKARKWIPSNTPETWHLKTADWPQKSTKRFEKHWAQDRGVRSFKSLLDLIAVGLKRIFS